MSRSTAAAGTGGRRPAGEARESRAGVRGERAASRAAVVASRRPEQEGGVRGRVGLSQPASRRPPPRPSRSPEHAVHCSCDLGSGDRYLGTAGRVSRCPCWRGAVGVAAVSRVPQVKPSGSESWAVGRHAGRPGCPGTRWGRRGCVRAASRVVAGICGEVGGQRPEAVPGPPVGRARFLRQPLGSWWESGRKGRRGFPRQVRCSTWLTTGM